MAGARKLKTQCSTPGTIYETRLTPTGFSASVTVPEGVDLSGLTKDDLRWLEEEIHRCAESVAWSMIRQARYRQGVYDLEPYLRRFPPDPSASVEDHNAQEIIRRAAAYVVKRNPELATDEPLSEGEG